MLEAVPVPENELARLAALEDYRLLDTPPEAVFDALARAAAQACGTPIGLVALVERDRLFLKSNVGLGKPGEVLRAGSFCAQAILHDEILEVPDARSDARFRAYPLVASDPFVRFYAGVPLVVPGGLCLGTLCVLDREPRRLTAEQRSVLRSLADAVLAEFESRRALLRANERIELLSAAVETAQDEILITTPTLDPAIPSVIVYANEAFLRQKQVTLEEVAGQSSTLFLGSKTDRKALTRFRELLLSGKSASVQFITYRKDGSEYYTDVAARPIIDAAGKVTHFVILTRDVTEAMTRGMTLELQNERLTALTSIARDLFGALDPRALAQSLLVGVRELTGGEGRLLAVRADGALVETDDLSVPAGKPDAGDAFLRTAITAPISVLDDENRRLAISILGAGRRAAFVLDVRAGEAPFVAVDVFAFGLLAQYLAIATRNVELYGELATRRSSVVELNQVKNDLIAMLAHDFKGPLTTIVGFADVLAEDERFDEESRSFLNMISSSAMRLAGLATDTLALSRLEQNEFSLHVDLVDLEELVRDVARIFSVTRTIDIRVDVKSHVVNGDTSRLRQVFENVIGNAIKYSPGGDAIEIRIRAMNDGVEVAIRDRGIGIPDVDRSKLFGRFARASNARELGIGGTGFGLYLSKRIVDMHGGTIDVTTRVGVGSTFRIFLPTSLKPQPNASRRVILLDADGDARSYIAHTLREDGLAISVAGNESEVLAGLDVSAFDAAVIDVDLLVSDEAAFIAQVANRTALVRLGAAGIPAESGWDAALGKPFLIKDLREAVDRAIGRHASS